MDLASQRPLAHARFAAFVVLDGVIAGLVAIVLISLLHTVQHVAYGYSLHELRAPESFYGGVQAASAARRVGVLVLCGAVAGGGWYLVHRYMRPLVSIERAVRSDDPRMPVAATTAHALLQIITVALGSPLGRETAPRELAAMAAGWSSHRAGLRLDESRRLVACAAGAALAALYNAPLGGAVFALEVLLATVALRAVLPAFAMSAIAVTIVWSVFGNRPVYEVPHMTPTASLLVWSVVAGPLIGVGGAWFHRLIANARARAPRDWHLPALCLVNFTAIGLLAIPFPELLGNGKSPAQLGFDSELGVGLAAVLLVLRIGITASSARAGANGGMLTPSLSNGALLAFVLGGVWSLVWPGGPLGAFALVAAAAYIAAAMSMPVTALALVVEFTWIDLNFLVPMLIAVAGAAAAAAAWKRFNAGSTSRS